MYTPIIGLLVLSVGGGRLLKLGGDIQLRSMTSASLGEVQNPAYRSATFFILNHLATFGVICYHFMLKQWIFYIGFALWPCLIWAQTDYLAEFDRLTDYRTPDDTKGVIAQNLSEALCQDLTDNAHFLDSLALRYIKKVNSDDGLLSLYTWHYTLSDGFSQYGGLLRYKGEVQKLIFNDRVIDEDAKYTADNWCGGIYYDVITVLASDKTYYTLLAWDGNNKVSTKKIIDVLSFDKRGRAIFGHPLFVDEHQTQHRVVLEYASNNSLLLEYDAEEKAIITNELLPNEARFAGVKSYYNVGDEFNAYRFEEGHWVLYRQVDLRMSKADSKVLEHRVTTPRDGL